MILAIYGAGGLGGEFYELAKETNEQTNEWENIIFVDDTPGKDGTKKGSAMIYNFEHALAAFGAEQLGFIIAVGEPALKDVLFQKLKDAGCEVVNLLHPTVRHPEGAKLGRGIVICNNSGIPPYATFGNNVLIQGVTAMGHDVVLGDNVVISSFAFVGGGATIGRNTYIAPHSSVRDGVHIGENAIIGMGSVVTKDIPDNAVAYGNPAKVMRYNDNARVFHK